MTAAEVAVDFAGLLDILGVTADEFVSVIHWGSDGTPHTWVGPPSQAPPYAAGLPETANVFFGVNPVRGPARINAGRGKEADIARLAVLPVDLDFKPGGCPSRDVALAIVAELGIILGTRCSAIVDSGHGLHAYWPVEDGQITDGDITRARALLKRWGRLVAIVAGNHKVRADSVFDLPRVMRLPGSHNNKGVNGEEPPLVTAQTQPGGPLAMAEVTERLTEVGISERDDDHAGGTEEVSSPTDWTFADHTCGYVAKMINAWATDRPKAGCGRNPFVYNQHIRLFCALRCGCVTEADYQRGRQVLADLLTELVTTTAPVRAVKRFEIADMNKHGIAKAASKTDAEALAEVGGHHHGEDMGSSPPADSGSKAKGGSRFFGKSGLLARDLADAVMRSVTCGFGYPDQRVYVYDGGVWLPDDGRIEGEITRLLGNRYRSAHTRSVLDLIRHTPGTVRITDNPLADWVNVPNGMIAWKTGDLLPHSPDYRSTVQLPVEYDADAACPLFEKFIAEVLPPDLYDPTHDSPGFIWELIGYTLYSGNPLHVAILLHGSGRNGKGTLIRVLKALLGGRNCSTVGLHQLVENRFRAATLFGKLANLAGDLDSKWLDNTALFKAITGGDTVQAEYKYGAAFDFAPWALPFYSINKAFGSADSSEGWVARWVVVPFPTSFIGREDRALDSRLQSEAELRGILRRGIEALPALMARGRFAEPESLREAKAAFVVASDAVRAWLDECCVLGSDGWAPRRALYLAYGNHAARDGSKLLSAREFYNRMEQVNGIRPAIREGNRGFSGVRLAGDGAAQGADAPATNAQVRV